MNIQEIFPKPVKRQPQPVALPTHQPKITTGICQLGRFTYLRHEWHRIGLNWYCRNCGGQQQP